MRDGWHDIYGRRVYVENDRILRGIIRHSPLNVVPGYVFRRVGSGWGREDHGVSVNAFRAGVRRGTIDLM